MTIQYALYENKLNTAKAHTFTAKVKSYQTISEDILVDELAKQGTTLTKTDIKAVLELLSDAIERNLEKGNTINLPFANFIPIIKGIFDSSTDQYDEKRHRVSVSVSLGNRLRKFSNLKIRPKKIRLPKPSPVIDNFQDLDSESLDSIMTPGGMGKLLGFHLVFDQQDTDQGVFILTQRKKRIRIPQYALIKSKMIIFMVPKDLEKGTYSIEVKAKFGSILRNAVHKKKLTVP